MSTLQVANISDGTDTVATGYVVNGSAKAGASLNGTATIALRSSLNLSSVTDEGTGQYTHTLTSSMTDTTYRITAAAGGSGDGGGSLRAADPSASRATGSYKIKVRNASAYIDVDHCESNLFGDLA
jgi:hypothetical protein